MSQPLASIPPPVNSVVLKVTAGPNKGDNYKVTPPGGILGRDPTTCNIVLNDPRVSRSQCRVDFTAGNITVKDLAEKKTTLVNEQPIEYVTMTSGDILKIGDTHIEFVMRGGVSEAPQLAAVPAGLSTPNPGGVPLASSPKKPLLNLPRLIILVVLVAGGILYLMPSAPKKKPQTVASNDAAQKAIEATLQRQEEIKNTRPNLKGNALYNAEKSNEHFIRGFRDFQSQKYNRAIEAFQTSVATNPSNMKSRRYQKLAEKKLRDSIDYHIDLGTKYKAKSMYRLCIAEFAMVLQIINQPNDKYYKLAKEQIKECRLAKQRDF